MTGLQMSATLRIVKMAVWSILRDAPSLCLSPGGLTGVGKIGLQVQLSSCHAPRVPVIPTVGRNLKC